MTRFEISEGDKKGFELRIKDDGWWRARAIIYDQWIAEELARDLGIKIKYNKHNSKYRDEETGEIINR